MKRTKRSLIELVAIILMTAIVFILGILQYRSTKEIGRAEQGRLKFALGTSVRNFDQAFAYDFQQLCESFEIDPEAPASTLEARVLHQYVNWAKTTSRVRLLASLQIWKTDDAHVLYFESFDQKNERFQKAVWPTQLESLHQFLRQQLGRLPSAISSRKAVYYPWTFYEDSPALIRPLFHMPSNGGSDSEVQPIGFLVVALSSEFLKREYLPELVHRNFGELGFGVAVRSAKAILRVIYSSEPDFTISTSSPDATTNLIESVGQEASRRGHPTLQPSDEAREWQLVVQHPSGSLDVAVAAWQRRSLAITFGLLAVLAGSVALVLSLTRRAEQLAKLQVEFVASVSHELCTPLAVINCAAENIFDGIIDNPRQIREYGGMIRDQGRRLERLVDKALLVAAGRMDRSEYELCPIEIAPIVIHSLEVSEPMLRDARFTVEKDVGAALPLVIADPVAVSKCMENLLSNAVKYSGANRWAAVRARVVETLPQSEVQISVEDKGIGIATSDLSKICEPFYRVQAIRDGQIRGVGLGLYLVKHMMEGMGGRMSVSSEIGRGSVFTLHFPVRGPTEHPAEEA